VHQRWNEGCTNVRQLHAELRDGGYHGGYGASRDYVQPFRDLGVAPPAVRPRRKPATSPAGSSPTRTTSMTRSRPDSARSGAVARTWTRSPGTSPSLRRSSPAYTVTASMPGSPQSRPTDNPTCTHSPTGSGGTTTPWSTGSPCCGTQASSRVPSTGRDDQTPDLRLRQLRPAICCGFSWLGE
jgi:hypothetical protein